MRNTSVHPRIWIDYDGVIDALHSHWIPLAGIAVLIAFAIVLWGIQVNRQEAAWQPHAPIVRALANADLGGIRGIVHPIAYQHASLLVRGGAR